jgi:hypothetical protein
MKMQGESAREVCPKDILLTLLDGPKQFETLVDALKDRYSRGTINKYLNELFKAEKITREGRRGPYVLTNRGEEEAEKEAMKRRINEKIDRAKPEELEILKQKISELEKELNYYKIKEKIQEYEDAPLPVLPIIEKLSALGFRNIRQLANCYKGGGGPFGKRDDEFSVNDIEIKLIPASEIEGITIEDAYGKIRKQEILIPTEVWKKYGRGYVILVSEPINGYYIIGAYRELLELYSLLFEYEWLEWKEKFNLSDEDWKMIGPLVCSLMLKEAGRVDLPHLIVDYLARYASDKKPEERIEVFPKLREMPVNEIWSKVEKGIDHLDEVSKRVFGYLKNKYAVL